MSSRVAFNNEPTLLAQNRFGWTHLIAFADLYIIFFWQTQPHTQTKYQRPPLHALRTSVRTFVLICFICVFVVSNALSAAVAFTFTILSKLLDYILKTLNESPLNKLLSGVKSAAEAGGSKRKQFAKDRKPFETKKEKARQIKQYRRRRRRKWSEDSSENENAMGDYTNHESNVLLDDSGSDLSEGEWQVS